MSVQDTLEAIDSKLDEVDALVMSMPLQDSVKRCCVPDAQQYLLFNHYVPPS